MTFQGTGPGLSIADDWRAYVRTRANVLVSGPRSVLAAFCETCRQDLQSPVADCDASELRHVDRCRTLVLWNVEQLTVEGQRALAAWLEEADASGVQVVSLTTEWLFDAVRHGRFDRDLFYRLNMIHLRLENGAER